MNFNWLPFKLVNKREFERIRKSSTAYMEKCNNLQIENEELRIRINTLSQKDKEASDEKIDMMKDIFDLKKENEDLKYNLNAKAKCMVDLQNELYNYKDCVEKYRERINNCISTCHELGKKYEKLKNDYMKVLASNGGLKRANKDLKEKLKQMRSIPQKEESEKNE